MKQPCAVHPLHTVTVYADGSREGCPMCEKALSGGYCTCVEDDCPLPHPVPNPRAGEVCRKCGNFIFTYSRRCEWDGGTCQPKKRW
jgi:hypothetical protein